MPRNSCQHGFRPSKLPGKVSLCTRCMCEIIDELLEKESDNPSCTNPSASTISDIIHNLRLINTSLDSNDQKMDGVLAAVEIRPLIDTLTGQTQTVLNVNFVMTSWSLVLFIHLASFYITSLWFDGTHRAAQVTKWWNRTVDCSRWVYVEVFTTHAVELWWMLW